MINRCSSFQGARDWGNEGGNRTGIRTRGQLIASSSRQTSVLGSTGFDSFDPLMGWGGLEDSRIL